MLFESKPVRSSWCAGQKELSGPGHAFCTAQGKGAFALSLLVSRRIQFSLPHCSCLQFYVISWQLWAAVILKKTHSSNSIIYLSKLECCFLHLPCQKNPTKIHLEALSLLLVEKKIWDLTLLYKQTLSNTNLVLVLLALKFKSVSHGRLDL